MFAIAIVAMLFGQSVEAHVNDLINQMTLDEKISLCHGANFFGTAAVPRLGIPSYNFTDGPNGVRMPWEQPATAFPPGIAMASTWNPGLIGQVGAAIAEETLAKGNAVILGPAVNIIRTPIGGRSFEYYSEDPYLTRQTAVAYINGVQSRGVPACVKHFAANSEEEERSTVNAQVDERTLREIYLPAFEGAVREAHVATVMAAYNKVNGQYSSENTHLLTDILKGEWGFNGYVMSDWGAVHSTVDAAMNGMDLEMPGNSRNFFGDPLKLAVQNGSVPERVIDDKVQRFLRVMLSYDARHPKLTPPLNSPAHQAVAQQVAEQAMVLLKNDKNLLPISSFRTRSVLVIGHNANQQMSAGGGSSMVNPPSEVTPLAGIAAYLKNRASVSFVDGEGPGALATPIPTTALSTEDGSPGLSATYTVGDREHQQVLLSRTDPTIDFDWRTNGPGPKVPPTHFHVRWEGYLTAPTSGTYYIGILNDDSARVSIDGKRVVDNSDGWGVHPEETIYTPVVLTSGKRVAITIDYRHQTSPSQIHLLWAPAPNGAHTWTDPAAEAARQAGKLGNTVILVVGTNHHWDGEGFDKPNLGLFGDEDLLTTQVLAANPNTIVVLVNGSAVTMPWISQAHAVLEAWYGGMRAGTALARVLFGDVSPSGKLPITFPVSLADSPAHANGNYPPKKGVLAYDEGILVGYRYYDTKQVAPLFPFGHGLSYTKFAYSAMRVQNRVYSSGFGGGGTYNIQFMLRNVGKVGAMETPQVYIRPHHSPVLRPMQELKAFTKVWLNSGSSGQVNITLPVSAFMYYSTAQHRWAPDPGDWDIAVGSSSRDIRLTATIHVG